MVLTLHRKSLYAGMIAGTQILRSVGKTLGKNSPRLKDFKIQSFNEIAHLIEKMDNDELTEADILCSIENLCKTFGVQFGQAQKAINTVLKYHFYLTKGITHSSKKVLHCPIDSIVLKELKRQGAKISIKSLSRIDKGYYLKLQEEIGKLKPSKIEFDDIYDKKYLESVGLL